MSKQVLLACEESQAVTIEMRKLGIEAWSCDLEPCSGGHPEWHIHGDAKEAIEHDKWDMIIAFPPCTHIASSGAPWFKQKRLDGFFMYFTDLRCKMVAIENPVGIMSTIYRKPDQIIQPYQFGDSFSKKTCLWLKGLPLLQPTNIVDQGEYTVCVNNKKTAKWHTDCWRLPPAERRKARSKTFPGIAKTIAVQWGKLL
jgi:hypothetical protein